MNDTAQTVATVVAIALGAILVLRILITVPGWVRRRRRPELRAIRVIGVGGGGSNAVDHMVDAGIPGVTFVACNTDAQALRRSTADARLRIGAATTGGLGSGGDPEVGRRAAEEDAARIDGIVAGADLVFITACLGGGTGSGAAPVFGRAARGQGALTIAVVTKPFAFEGTPRRHVADTAAAELAANVDAIITIPNDRVADVVPGNAPLLDAFRVVDGVLLQAVQGVIDLLQGPGLINLDFADVRAIMHDAGPALIGLGRGSGEQRALDAARQAIASPLLEADIGGARGILFNVSGPPDLSLAEVRAAADEIRARADPDANVIFGASCNRPAGEDVLITLIATGLDRTKTGEPAADRVAAGTPDTPPASRTIAASTPPEGSTNGQLHQVPKAKPKPRRAVLPVPMTESPPSGPDIADAIDYEVPSFLRRRQPPATTD